MSEEFPECEQFKDVSHQYGNCRHERLTPEKCDNWRQANGLPRLKTDHQPKVAQFKMTFTGESESPKEWDVSQPSRGLGDVIKKFTHSTGIDKVVEAVAEAVTGKKECGCKKRQEAMNNIVPFKAAE